MAKILELKNYTQKQESADSHPAINPDANLADIAFLANSAIAVLIENDIDSAVEFLMELHEEIYPNQSPQPGR